MACVVATTTTTPASNAFATMLRSPHSSRRMAVQTETVPVLVRAFEPLPPLLSLALPADASVATVLAATIQSLRLPAGAAQMLRITHLGGQTVPANAFIGSLTGPPMRNRFGQMVQPPVTLEVRLGMRGGKGGFGSQLRAAGGKMSANRNGEENRDSCRDLNGRRLSTVKQAQQLAAYVASQDERQRAMNAAQKKKYAKLERMLGRKPREEADFIEAAQKLDDEGGDLGDAEEEEQDDAEGNDRATASSSTLPARRTEPVDGKGKKRERIEDHEYVEQSRAIVDNVRSAVASAMLKKKRKSATTNGKSKTVSSSEKDSTKASATVEAA